VPTRSTQPDEHDEAGLTLAGALEIARTAYWETPARALAAASLLAAAADEGADPFLRGSALVAVGSVALRRGEFDRAFEVFEAAELQARLCREPHLEAQIAIARCRLSFFSGAYHAALARCSDLERRTSFDVAVRHDELQRVVYQSRSERQHTELLAAANEELEQLVTRLEEAQDERARLLARTVELAEDERIRVSTDLHDGPIQRLTAAALSLDRLRLRLTRGELDGVEQLVGDIREQLADEMVSLRRLMTELRPPIIDLGGLAVAVRECAQQVLAGSGVELDVHCGIEGARLAPELETVVYRVARETLLNAATHAGASRVEVLLEADDDVVRLVVADDGCGFTPEEVDDHHLGLLGVQERVESVGGTLRLRSAPGCGTRVEAFLPWKARSLP
jgi:signal transduction histidine kinase